GPGSPDGWIEKVAEKPLHGRDEPPRHGYHHDRDKNHRALPERPAVGERQDQVEKPRDQRINAEHENEREPRTRKAGLSYAGSTGGGSSGSHGSPLVMVPLSETKRIVSF